MLKAFSTTVAYRFRYFGSTIRERSSNTISCIGNQLGRAQFNTRLPVAFESSPSRYITTSSAVAFPRDRDLFELLEKNQKWAELVRESNPEYFEKLSQPQTPDYLYIGCADSRVPASVILGVDPGTLFTHRNVGNQFSGHDMNALAVLDFAVNGLKVKHIIVTGHYGCGAVQAAMTNQDHGTIETWIGQIRDVYRLHSKELDDIADDDERVRRLVELNVLEQCINLYKTGIVQRKRAKTAARLKDQLNTNGSIDPSKPNFSTPRIHGLVFDPRDGIMHKLPFKEKIRELISQNRHIYDIYDVDKVEGEDH